MNLTLRLEEEKDYKKVEYLIREAFWDLYHPGCDEHFVTYKLRNSNDMIKPLDFVVLDGEKIVGHIIYSKCTIMDENSNSHEVITFGPISIDPEYQHKGIGSMLINHTKKLAKELGYKGIVIFGNPAYYHRFGFENAEKFNITTADGLNFDAFMALELYENSLSNIKGKFFESPVFHYDKDEFEEYEKQFPYREKHITDTQLK